MIFTWFYQNLDRNVYTINLGKFVLLKECYYVYWY